MRAGAGRAAAIAGDFAERAGAAILRGTEAARDFGNSGFTREHDSFAHRGGAGANHSNFGAAIEGSRRSAAETFSTSDFMKHLTDDEQLAFVEGRASKEAMKHV